MLTKLSAFCAFLKMAKFPVLYVLLCCLYGFSADPSTLKRRERGAAHWGYTSDNGPSTWGGVCLTGSKQSPINIQLGKAIVKSFPPFTFDQSYLNKHKFYAKNNGHTIYVSFDDSIRPAVKGGGLDGQYIFEQLHFHWESEHEFDGRRADLEMHMVHYNSKYESFGEAAKYPDGVAVLTVIFDETTETDNVIEEFFSYILDLSSLEEHPHGPVSPDNSLFGTESVENSGFFALRDLLPKYLTKFFRYEGSLTTPDCGEVVQWTIFINRLPVSRSVLDGLRTLHDHDGNLLTQNFRPVQNLNGRDVFIQMKNFDGSPGTELDQYRYNCGNAKTLISIQLLCCSLFLLCRFN